MPTENVLPLHHHCRSLFCVFLADSHTDWEQKQTPKRAKLVREKKRYSLLFKSFLLKHLFSLSLSLFFPFAFCFLVHRFWKSCNSRKLFTHSTLEDMISKRTNSKHCISYETQAKTHTYCAWHWCYLTPNENWRTRDKKGARPTIVVNRGPGREPSSATHTQMLCVHSEREEKAHMRARVCKTSGLPK